MRKHLAVLGMVLSTMGGCKSNIDREQDTTISKQRGAICREVENLVYAIPLTELNGLQTEMYPWAQRKTETAYNTARAQNNDPLQIKRLMEKSMKKDFTDLLPKQRSVLYKKIHSFIPLGKLKLKYAFNAITSLKKRAWE